ncbi:MAG TPA: MFS transporter [Modicisalibacter sp.]|nr:MFS transporter [Modicisalibacter sp.]
MRLPPVWRISACAALLGLGQNGLLVALPVLVARFGLPLSQWAGLILLGSMLFLIGSPFWGRVADRHGARLVVMQALAGYTLSFAMIAAALWLTAQGMLSSAAMLALLVLARVLYGLTVSGMVPACQQWALALHGREDRGEGRIAALASISAGLSAGRLLGPLVAAASLSFSAYAPFVIMLLGALLALALLRGVPRPAPKPRAQTQAASLLPAPGNLPYLGMALLLAMSVSLMQLGLPMALQQALDVNATRAGHLMGILLSLGALGALSVQLGVIRSRRLNGRTLLSLGGAGLALGYALLAQASALVWFMPGILIASIGAALAVPGYTEAATRHQAQGASAGFLGMAHTLGYGGATLAVSLIAAPHLLHLALIAALLMLALLPLARRRYRALETLPFSDRD